MGDYFFTPSFHDPKREHNILEAPEPEAPAPRRGETKRKRLEREKEEEEEKELALLAVVGYGSKLFRDDETSKAVNDGKFLVPWMGDAKLMIDRYDVRALLDDRKLFKKLKNRAARGSSKGELEEEAALDYERYYDLEHYEEALEKGTCPPDSANTCFTVLFVLTTGG